MVNQELRWILKAKPVENNKSHASVLLRRRYVHLGVKKPNIKFYFAIVDHHKDIIILFFPVFDSARSFTVTG